MRGLDTATNLILLEETQLLSDREALPLVIIGTHNGSFHMDEVTACVMLHWLKDYAEAPICRTRNDEALAKCQVVVDVGGIHDEEIKRFDHHQRTFGETWSAEKNQTRLSSAGLVWRYFGKRILNERFGVPAEQVDFLHGELYTLIFENLDANDNGVSGCPCNVMAFAGGMPGLSGRCTACNTSWCIPEKMDESICFKNAYETVTSGLEKTLAIYARHYCSAGEEIKAALKTPIIVETERKEVFAVIELPKYFRYADFVPRFEPEAAASTPVVGVVFEEDEEWTFRVLNHSFTNRTPRCVISLAESRDEKRRLLLNRGDGLVAISGRKLVVAEGGKRQLMKAVARYVALNRLEHQQ